MTLLRPQLLQGPKSDTLLGALSLALGVPGVRTELFHTLWPRTMETLPLVVSLPAEQMICELVADKLLEHKKGSAQHMLALWHQGGEYGIGTGQRSDTFLCSSVSLM